MAACHAAKNAIWLGEFLEEVGVRKECMTILSDNMSSIALAKNPVMHKRTKHIKIQWHFIRDLVANREIELVYVRTEEQAADMLTKAALKEVYDMGKLLVGME